MFYEFSDQKCKKKKIQLDKLISVWYTSKGIDILAVFSERDRISVEADGDKSLLGLVM